VSENNILKNNDVAPAQLQDGENLIPHPLVEKYNEYVKDLNDKSAEANEADGNDVISSNNAATNPNPSVVLNSADVIGSSVASKKEEHISRTDKKKDVIAVYSTKNVTWSGVGEVSKGYNIVTRQAAEKWATRDHIRIATPEEVARDFGK
jgi:hypothetical protein